MGCICNCLLEPNIYLWHESSNCAYFNPILEIGEMVVWLALDVGNTCHCRYLPFLANRLRFLF